MNTCSTEADDDIPVNRDTRLEKFTAYRVALGTGRRGTWVDLELEMKD